MLVLFNASSNLFFKIPSFKVFFTCTFQTNQILPQPMCLIFLMMMINPCNVPYDNVPGDDGDDDGPDENVYIHHLYLFQTTI